MAISTYKCLWFLILCSDLHLVHCPRKWVWLYYVIAVGDEIDVSHITSHQLPTVRKSANPRMTFTPQLGFKHSMGSEIKMALHERFQYVSIISSVITLFWVKKCEIPHLVVLWVQMGCICASQDQQTSMHPHWVICTVLYLQGLCATHVSWAKRPDPMGMHIQIGVWSKHAQLIFPNYLCIYALAFCSYAALCRFRSASTEVLPLSVEVNSMVRHFNGYTFSRPSMI